LSGAFDPVAASRRDEQLAGTLEISARTVHARGVAMNQNTVFERKAI
jgi:hypothetical protein